MGEKQAVPRQRFRRVRRTLFDGKIDGKAAYRLGERLIGKFAANAAIRLCGF
jgi:hypothetical protein